MPERKTFGRLLAPDRRDARHPLRRRKSARTYRFWPDYQWFGDQGDEPACVGFAWAHWLSAAPISQFVDPRGIYRLAQFLDEWEGQDYEGTSVRGGAKVLAQLGFIASYQWAWSLPPLISTLLEVGPVVVGTQWYEGMEAADAAGFVRAAGEPLGGHAYLLTGVDTKAKKFRIKNSWGRGWGLHGRAWIRFDDFERLLNDDGECCLGVEAAPRGM